MIHFYFLEWEELELWWKERDRNTCLFNFMQKDRNVKLLPEENMLQKLEADWK